ncbi:trimeric intracellular cation channel family protein [Nakamurella sp. A5-74]|uniref:Trimeric intracellular cation channel family protein n=1 Tax=Nakamurella sp. A5-74 TaxID=3158264 RepID=A0AAU8DIZ9_9ACTN
MTQQAVEVALNLIGLIAFALSGALMAVRKDMDVIGMVVLAAITALGGGVIRDVLLGDTPPVALRTTWWLVVPLAAAALTFFFHPVVARLRRAVLVFDAIGLGVFCAAATTKGIAAGLGPLGAVVIGIVTGVGGGILRDVLAGEIPSVLRRDTQLYAVAALTGCVFVAVAHELGQDGLWVQFVAAAGICALRLAALWRGWGAPAPGRRIS